ncbi:NHL repeat containing protein (modular protein) [Candidatus Sulfopaludibacter sp. SbA4]|nr:NHL repeat containing protein (modular protein) [Candidatus Sulfopaludibacter sp. SbA4]
MRPQVPTLAVLLLFSQPAIAQTIDTVAGSGPPAAAVPDGAAAASVRIGSPQGVAIDSAGNLYVASPSLARVFKVDTGGLISTVAGNGNPAYSGDGGPATGAGLTPYRVAADSAGNLYIADNQRVRKVSGGIITTVAGNGQYGSSGDGGPATSAAVSPNDVAVDTAGNLYIMDGAAALIRKVSGGIITRFAQVSSPNAIAVDTAGNVYVADNLHNVIIELGAGGVTTVAGNGSRGSSGDGGQATNAQVSFPTGLAVDGAGNLYIADSNTGRIRKVSGGIITTVAGSGASDYSGDGGQAANAGMNPADVAVDSAGNLYIADGSNQRVRKVAGGVISTAAGGGTNYAGDGGPATSARLSTPQGVAADAAGNYYIVDTGNHRIRKVTGGIIGTVAGNGIAGYSGDGIPALSAQLNQPSRAALDSAGNLYIADTNNHRVRKVAGGTISTVAGNGTPGFSGDGGQAIDAALNYPSGVAVDGAGNLYIADSGNNRVRQVSGGAISTLAGNGTGGDNGPAVNASLSNPTDIAVDADGNLYIAETGRRAVRKISGGIITTAVPPPDPLTPSVGAPVGLAIDAAGRLYVSDGYVVTSGDFRAGQAPVCLHGYGCTQLNDGFSGDGGPAVNAQLEQPAGIAVDANGALYIADSGNNRIRRVCNIPITVATNPSGLSITIDGGTYTAPQTTYFCSSETHTIGVPVSQPGGAVFASWSDGGAQTHPIAVESPATYTASFTVNPPAVPSAGLPQPAAGSAWSQAFTFQFSDPGGYQNLSVVNILINNFLDGRQACYLAYVVPSGQLVLVDDGGHPEGPYAGSVVLGDLRSIGNSQCSVSLVLAAGSGTTLSLTLNITFQPAFGGNRIVYLAARDAAQNNSGWQAMGVWQVPWTPAGTIAAAGATPAHASTVSGTPQTIALTFTDSKGAADIGIVNLLINDSIDGRQACYLAYVASSNSIILVDDAGDAGGPFAGSMALNGAGGTLGNSQCQVNAAGSSAALNGNTLALTLSIAANAAFAGNRIVYVAGRDCNEGNNTGWQAMGTWTVR